MQEISMGIMNFDGFDAQRLASLCRFDKSLLDPF